MAIAFLMDAHVKRAITEGLRLRGVNVLTAQEDGSDRLTDRGLLDRASELGRLLFTNDHDFLREAAERQSGAIEFSGIVYAHLRKVSVGDCVRDLDSSRKWGISKSSGIRCSSSRCDAR